MPRFANIVTSKDLDDDTMHYAWQGAQFGPGDAESLARYGAEHSAAMAAEDAWVKQRTALYIAQECHALEQRGIRPAPRMRQISTDARRRARMDWLDQ